MSTLYIFISIIFTYKYYKGISSPQVVVQSSDDIEKEKIHAKIEKERLKIMKKKSKADVKAKKKITK